MRGRTYRGGVARPWRVVLAAVALIAVAAIILFAVGQRKTTASSSPATGTATAAALAALLRQGTRDTAPGYWETPSATLAAAAAGADDARFRALGALLVQDGFAILKVGPALTFAMREALTDLSQVEAELVPHWQSSHLADVLERVMLDKPANWQQHYAGNGQTAHLLRRYSYSDRVRYYWHEPRVKEAVDVLMANLRNTSIAETLLSCFLPDEYRAVRAGTLQPDAHSLIIHRIRGVLRPYAAACGN